eukprot:Pompholyxophrys_punicea_v1_NODE_1200_length_870_cov_1.514110.p1 type:complete len:198 gc:universal NODE_1200_length_870_cov_1.514110:28-621(+)
MERFHYQSHNMIIGLCFSRCNLEEYLKWTSDSLKADRKTPTSKKEFGILYAMAFRPIKGSRERYWDTEDGLFPAPNFSRFGMSNHRFETILSHIKLNSLENPGNDKWWPIRKFVDDLNQPMCSWRGKSGNYCDDGMPHVTKIVRKPESVGVEIKTIADAVSCVIIRLEIVEKKEDMQQKAFQADLGAGRMQTLGLPL